MIGGDTKYPSLDGVFSPVLPPAGLLMDECFHADGDKRGGWHSHADCGVKHRSVCFCSHLVDKTLTVVFMNVV